LVVLIAWGKAIAEVTTDENAKSRYAILLSPKLRHFLAMTDLIYFLAGIICAGLGGELFIRGTVGLASCLRVSASIIGVTVAAFATSSPELSVGISSALAGTPQIVLGNCVGSNVLNVALILGLALLIGAIHVSRDDIGRNFLTSLLTPVAIGVLAVDGMLSRLDGILLLAVFAIWMTVVVVEARKQRSTTGRALSQPRVWTAVSFCAIGLILLIAAGRLVVVGASGIAVLLGIDKFVVGAVFIAVGTTIPEFATTVISKLRGHEEIGLNTILGSNIFNGLLIIGIVSVIHPIVIKWGELRVALLFGVATVAMILPSRCGLIPRWRGAILLAMYVAYVIATLWR